MHFPCSEQPPEQLTLTLQSAPRHPCLQKQRSRRHTPCAQNESQLEIEPVSSGLGIEGTVSSAHICLPNLEREVREPVRRSRVCTCCVCIFQWPRVDYAAGDYHMLLAPLLVSLLVTARSKGKPPHQNTADAPYFCQPPSTKPLLAVLGVFSSTANAAFRQQSRTSWMIDGPATGILPKFVLGVQFPMPSM